MEQHEHDPLDDRFEGTVRIPGERDANTLTHRQPGSMGGSATGDNTPSPDPRNVMDDETIRDRKSEGGATGR